MAVTIYFVGEYAIEDEEELLHVKIGHTTDPLYVRMRALQTGNPRTLHALFSASESVYAESFLQRFFRTAKVRGEWFRPTSRLLEFIDHCDDVGKLDLVHLAPCSWEDKGGWIEQTSPPCLGCDLCNQERSSDPEEASSDENEYPSSNT